jgi:hypothetical protein
MHRSIPLTLSLFLAVGCGPWPIKGRGEEGRLNYRLSTDTSVLGSSLDEVSIITGTEQEVNASLTWSASIFADADDDFQHELFCDGRADWGEDPEDEEGLPPVLVTAEEPGDCVLETYRGDRAYDRIALHFDEVAAIDARVRVSYPDTDEYEELEELPSTLPVGTSLRLDPIPLAFGGAVLAGRNDITMDIVIDDGLSYDLVDWFFDTPYELVRPGLVSIVFEDERTGARTQMSCLVVED